MAGTSRILSEQEQFWAGEFGDEYTQRNDGPNRVQSNFLLFSKIFKRPITSFIEFGANRGLNLQALQALFPQAKLSGVEINTHAVERLKEQNFEVFETSILDFEPKHQYEVALSKGVLIHINPDDLLQVYEKLYQSAERYICLVEYYNPVPVEVTYRGHQNRLFKRDFCGEMLAVYPDLSLVNYGFVYHKDPIAPQDDLTWFLLEKAKI